MPGRGVGATATGVRSRHVSNSTKLLNLRPLHPSLNERSERPGEGSVRSTGGEVIHREQRQQADELERTLLPLACRTSPHDLR